MTIQQELESALDKWKRKFEIRQDPEFYDVVRLLELAVSVAQEKAGLEEEKAALTTELWAMEKKIAWMESRLRFGAGKSA
jgi:hypothetical protein